MPDAAEPIMLLEESFVVDPDQRNFQGYGAVYLLEALPWFRNDGTLHRRINVSRMLPPGTHGFGRGAGFSRANQLRKSLHEDYDGQNAYATACPQTLWCAEETFSCPLCT